MKTMSLAVSAAAFAALAIGIAGVSPAKADANAAYCLDGYGTTGQVRLCNFYTLDQCKATASGVAGSCIANPYLNDANANYNNYRSRRH